MISTSLVNNAYGNSTRLQGGAGQIESSEAAGASFGEMLRSATQESVQVVREAEQVQQAGLTGEVSAQKVVEATLEMETTLKLAVSVRDKLVEAYQQIMQMPV